MYPGEKLEFYDETYEEPICYKATVFGPHNTQLNRIVTIEEAYRTRASKMS